MSGERRVRNGRMEDRKRVMRLSVYCLSSGENGEVRMDLIRGKIDDAGVVTMGSTLHAFAQEQITDQVGVVISDGKAFGATSGQGLTPIRLRGNEEVVRTEARGINALVETNSRLLAFSGPFRKWSEQRLDTSEEVQGAFVTPRLIFVQTNHRLYGYQGPRGQWKVQDLSVRERLKRTIVEDHVVVVVTNSRALAFFAFLGGFFSEDLRSDEVIVKVNKNDNIVTLQTSFRMLMFRSNLAFWKTLR